MLHRIRLSGNACGKWAFVKGSLNLFELSSAVSHVVRTVFATFWFVLRLSVLQVHALCLVVHLLLTLVLLRSVLGGFLCRGFLC